MNHFSCKLDWKPVEKKDAKIKYIVEERKNDESTVQVYAGFGTDCKVDDLQSLTVYKYRLRIEEVGSDKATHSEWPGFQTWLD